jgi:ribosome assembly protein RRB1
MPLQIKPTSNKRARITSSRFDDEEQEEITSTKKVYEAEDDSDEENDESSGELVSDGDVSDDEYEDEDFDMDEDEVLDRLKRVMIGQQEQEVDENKKNEQYYSQVIQNASKQPEFALDYDYQEADEEEYMEKVEKTKDNVAVFNPKKYQLAEDEELQFSNEAYIMFHRMDVEWPCLSFGLIDDQMGQQRTNFPLTQYLIAGSQADEKNKNRLYIMKTSNMRRTQYDSDEDVDSSDDEAEDTVKNQQKSVEKLAIPTKDPILEHLYIPLDSEVNRLRCMPQNTKICAVMCSDSSLRIFNVQTQFDLLNRDTSNSNKILATGEKKAMQILKSHKNEGFALDWSSVEQGRLGSGDFDANICVHNMQTDGTWKLLNNYKRHTKSVEDIQWSPNEGTVFASVGCDGKVLIWDSRQPKQEGLGWIASERDVNVVSWNKLKQYHIATGDDAGVVTVWDLKTISNTKQPEPVARFNYLEGEHVTSMEWHPYDDSVLAVSTDYRVTLWDLSVEKDMEEKMNDDDNNAEDNLDVPEQLLFEHYGYNLKDVHWSTCLKDVLVCSGEMGIQIWRPAHVFGDE